MEYRLTNLGAHRSEAYRFTVSSKTDISLLNLKMSVKWQNKNAYEYIRWHHEYYGTMPKHNRVIQRVSLMARGPRTDGNGKRLHPNAESCLRHEYATHYDVYVGQDTHATFNLTQQLESGLTAVQYRAVEKAKNDMFLAKWAIKADLMNKYGIRIVGTSKGTEYLSK